MRDEAPGRDAILNTPRKDDEETVEHPFRGRVTIYQPARGFRYSVDAFLLVDFAARTISGRKTGGVSAAELGSGTGVISLGLALYPEIKRIIGIEIIPELVRMSNRSAAASGLAGKTQFVEGDLKNPQAAGMGNDSFDMVVSNPPYRQVEKGRVSRDFARAVARHEVAAKIADVAQAASRLLKSDGTLCVVYVPERLPELLVKLEDAGLKPRRIRFVHPHETDPAKMVLVEARKSSKGSLTIAPSFFVNDDSGNYTEEAQNTFEGPP